MTCLQALGQAVFKLGVIAIVPILCVPLYYRVGFAFVKEPAPQSVIIRLGNTVLEVPSEVVIEDVYFGKAWTSESRLDHSSSINIELPIFEKSRPSIITLHPFTNEDQLAHPESVDAYLGNGRYSDRFIRW
ncbi:hypothetical protein [Thalassospira sp.]|uniref:hypothetical protein n=1 Tax=Thalassospira sp. TaxID=1912094 RepID=UPI00311FE960